jgi:hypothetical protein
MEVKACYSAHLLFAVKPATSESALQQREEIRFLHFTAFRALFKKY